jgi:hypothetical protein
MFVKMFNNNNVNKLTVNNKNPVRLIKTPETLVVQ